MMIMSPQHSLSPPPPPHPTSSALWKAGKQIVLQRVSITAAVELMGGVGDDLLLKCTPKNSTSLHFFFKIAADTISQIGI
jgi:hypothetical protein